MNKVNLPTAAELSKLPSEFRAKIAKRNRNKGSNYERDVAKKIANHFGFKWDQAFFRTKPHGMAQPNGDLQPINDMYDAWRGAKLGPIECKNRLEWSFDNLLRSPKDSHLVKYWEKSNLDCNRNNTVLFFTKNACTDYVMFTNHRELCFKIEIPFIQFSIGDDDFNICTLKDFLYTFWPH